MINTYYLLPAFFCPAVQTHTNMRYSSTCSWQKDGFPLSRPNSLHCRCVRVYFFASGPPLSLSTPPPFYCPFAGASKGLFLFYLPAERLSKRHFFGGIIRQPCEHEPPKKPVPFFRRAPCLKNLTNHVLHLDPLCRQTQGIFSLVLFFNRP